MVMSMRSGVFQEDSVLRFCQVSEFEVVGLGLWRDFREGEFACVYLWFEWYGVYVVWIFHLVGVQGRFCLGGAGWTRLFFPKTGMGEIINYF